MKTVELPTKVNYKLGNVFVEISPPAQVQSNPSSPKFVHLPVLVPVI